MRYDISKATAPAMPNLGKGTECIRLLLSQTSKDMHEPLVPMLFPVLGAHISGAEFQYPDLTWKELCGQMAKEVSGMAETGEIEGQQPGQTRRTHYRLPGYLEQDAALCRHAGRVPEGELRAKN